MVNKVLCDTFVVSFSNNTQQKPNREKFGAWNRDGQRVHVTLFSPDAAFSAVPFCSYTVRRTQYDRPS